MNTAFQTLERLRRIDLDRCRIALGRARKFESELRTRLQTTQENQNGQWIELDEMTSQGPILASTIRLRHDHLTDLAAQALELNTALRQAEAATQLQTQALIAAERQWKVAEKLHEIRASRGLPQTESGDMIRHES